MFKPAYRKILSKAKAFLVLACVCGAFSGEQTKGQVPAPRQIKVAAAADLQPLMPALAYAFEREKGIQLVVSFGSSATLATGIVHGMPMDVFLGADFSFPERIVAAGLTDAKAPTAYAIGSLVLWARKDSPLQPLHLEELTEARVQRIAIGNELHAPYGRAASSALHSLKVYEHVKSKLVVAENIEETAQLVESGKAQVGLLSLTAAESERFKQIGSYVLLPPVSYPKIVQYGVVLKNSAAKAEANAFMEWLTSPKVQAELPKFGLQGVR